MTACSFEEYVATLSRITAPSDPTMLTPADLEIQQAVATLESLETADALSLEQWITDNPEKAFILGLVVGISREKLHNHLRDWFGTASWRKASQNHASQFIKHMDDAFDLIRLLKKQRNRSYTFADILIARAGTRSTAAAAGRSGRRVEDELEAISRSLRLPHKSRTRFEGRTGRTAPADLAVPDSGSDCVIAVAAKGFDSTGSKMSDAVREIEEMADARTGRQIVLAVVDGIGWKGRLADLQRIWSLWDRGDIDGLYTLNTVDRLRSDLDHFATLRGIEREQPDH